MEGVQTRAQFCLENFMRFRLPLWKGVWSHNPRLNVESAEYISRALGEATVEGRSSSRHSTLSPTYGATGASTAGGS